MNRRELIQSITAAVAADYDAAEYSIDGEWEWGERGGLYRTASIRPEEISGSLESDLLCADLGPDDLSNFDVQAQYDRRGVKLNMHVGGEVGEFGLLANLSEDEARELAIGLWQAVDQRQRRSE